MYWAKIDEIVFIWPKEDEVEFCCAKRRGIIIINDRVLVKSECFYG